MQRQRDGVLIIVTNPGAYLGPRPGSDGLPTLEQRLQLAYDGAARLRISTAADRTRIELELPQAPPQGIDE